MSVVLPMSMGTPPGQKGYFCEADTHSNKYKHSNIYIKGHKGSHSGVHRLSFGTKRSKGAIVDG